MIQKVCKTCGIAKRVGEFYKTTARNKDGRVNDCKRCYSAKTTAYKELNYKAVQRKRRIYDASPQAIAKRAAYRRTAEGIEAQRKACRLYGRWRRISGNNSVTESGARTTTEPGSSFPLRIAAQQSMAFAD